MHDTTQVLHFILANIPMSKVRLLFPLLFISCEIRALRHAEAARYRYKFGGQGCEWSHALQQKLPSQQPLHCWNERRRNPFPYCVAPEYFDALRPDRFSRAIPDTAIAPGAELRIRGFNSLPSFVCRIEFLDRPGSHDTAQEQTWSEP